MHLDELTFFYFFPIHFFASENFTLMTWIAIICSADVTGNQSCHVIVSIRIFSNNQQLTAMPGAFQIEKTPESRQQCTTDGDSAAKIRQLRIQLCCSGGLERYGGRQGILAPNRRFSQGVRPHWLSQLTAVPCSYLVPNSKLGGTNISK